MRLHENFFFTGFPLGFKNILNVIIREIATRTTPIVNEAGLYRETIGATIIMIALLLCTP